MNCLGRKLVAVKTAHCEIKRKTIRGEKTTFNGLHVCKTEKNIAFYSAYAN